MNVGFEPRVLDTKSPADWMPADKPTELSRIKLKKLELDSPSLWSFSPLDPLPVGFRTWPWRYTCLLLLISLVHLPGHCIKPVCLYSRYQWYIPVTYRTSTNETGIEWVNKTFGQYHIETRGLSLCTFVMIGCTGKSRHDNNRCCQCRHVCWQVSFKATQ